MRLKRALVVLLLGMSVGAVTAHPVSSSNAAPRPSYVGCCR